MKPEASESTSTVADLGALRVDGTDVPGFSADVEEYSVTTKGTRYPQVTAAPVDSQATVTVDQPTEATDGLATVTVTAPDSTTTRSYTVDVDRQVAVFTVAVAGDPTVGSTVTATSVTDPAEATVSYRWRVDGAEVATGTELDLADVAVGASVTLAATAERDGLTTSDEVLSTPVVVRAVTPDPEPTPGPTDPEPTPGPTPGPTAPAPEPTEPPTGSEPTAPILPGTDVPFAVTLSSTSVRAGGTLTVAPSASAAADGVGLAATGAEVTSLAGVALLLLGAGSVVVLRRRRLAQDR